jgi:hypothetical protein
MREQLEMFAGDAPGDGRVYTDELVNRSGPARYVHLIRFASDPQRSRAAKRDPFAWRKLDEQSPEEWAARIVAHLGDGQARTFNRIMVELTNFTADVAFDSNADSGLWRAVERTLVVHTLEAPIFFRLAARAAGGRSP